MCSALLPLDRRVQHMCKRHFLLLIKLGRAIFGICSVQQHLTAAAAVSLHHRYPTRVTQDVFPPPLKTRAESTQTSRAMVKKKKNHLASRWANWILCSLPIPIPIPTLRLPLVCELGLRTCCFFTFAHNNTNKAPSAFSNNNNSDESEPHH